MTALPDRTDRVYMPRQTIALAIALVAAGATAGSGFAYQSASNREAIADLRTHMEIGLATVRAEQQTSTRELKQALCLLRADVRAKGASPACTGEYNYSTYQDRAGTYTYAVPPTERVAGMSDRVLAYLIIGVIAASIAGVAVLVRTFGQYMEVDREKIRQGRATEKAIKQFLDEVQAWRGKRGNRFSPNKGFPHITPDDIRQDGGL